MNVIECPREPEILEAITTDAWRETSDEDLRHHARGCAVCAEVLEVGLALRDDYRAAMREARIPPPALLWWRAELRVREDAARTAARPITLVQGFAAAASVGVIAALAGFLLPSIRGWLSRFGAAGLDLVPEIQIGAEALRVSGIPIGLPFLIGIGCCLMLASLAVYWIFSEE